MHGIASRSRAAIVMPAFVAACTLFYGAHQAWSQHRIEALESIRIAISNGDARALTSLTSGTLELALIGASRQYSSSQAALVLNRFFEENRPQSFEIIDSTRSSRGLFIEGRIRTEDKNRPLRAYLRLNQTAGAWILRELLIERLDP